MINTDSSERRQHKYELKIIDYILSLGNSNHPNGSYKKGFPQDLTRIDYAMYLDGQHKYEKLKEEGKEPIFMKIMNNLSQERQPLRGNISGDEAYTFLVDLREKVEEIAEKFYVPLEEGPPGEHVPEGENYCVYHAAKKGFLNRLIMQFEERGLKLRERDEKDSLINQERYDWLQEFAKEKANDVEAIEELVDNFPSAPWDSFSWPCDTK